MEARKTRNRTSMGERLVNERLVEMLSVESGKFELDLTNTFESRVFEKLMKIAVNTRKENMADKTKRPGRKWVRRK